MLITKQRSKMKNKAVANILFMAAQKCHKQKDFPSCLPFQ